MDTSLVKRSMGRESFRTFQEGIRKEWVITNGMGGYAGSSIIGANTRKHHGLLIASLHAPTDRKQILSRIQEDLIINDSTFSLSSVQRKKRLENGWLYQQNFTYDCVPSFTYMVEGIHITKTITFEYGKNTVAILYHVDNQTQDAVLSFTPAFNYRDHNDGSKRRDLKFKHSHSSNIIELVPEKDKSNTISFYISEGTILPTDKDKLYDTDIELQTEIDTGMSSSDTSFCPYTIQIGISRGCKKDISFICSLENSFESDAYKTIQSTKNRAMALIETAGYDDPFFKSLVLAGDQFITYRQSTGEKTILAGLPWFTDWGRDTMIALTGTTLVTKRYDDAKSILRTFCKYEKNGILPNMFPDTNTTPLYNTVDASLWYFYCIHQYLKFVPTKEALHFVHEEIYPCLKRIIHAYQNGTDFSIYMEKDGLIHAGSNLDQVTWMDVRVGEWVVTPRHGKPVEICALWYNALKVTESLAYQFDDNDYASSIGEIARLTKSSFCERFWNPQNECLYDVVDEISQNSSKKTNNDCIRPNQIWAVSLPYTMLPREQEQAIVRVVLQKLYTDFGLRTLPKEDPNYHGTYFGKLSDRDAAYHQGTAWAFPLGGLVSAYLKVNDYSKEASQYARELLRPMINHLNDGCVGSIAEIFDADAPHISRGCYAQAWSVGEIMRAYYEVLQTEITLSCNEIN